jgi:hypothetical protein
MSITTSNRLWLKLTYRKPLYPLASLMTSSKRRMDCSSMRKSSDKVAASWSFGSAIHLWKVSWDDGESQNLNGLTNQNKLIWPKFFVILTARNKDMKSITNLKKLTSGGIGRIFGHCPLLFDIIIWIHIESLMTIFRYVASTSEKTEKYWVSEIWASMLFCKSAILCTPGLNNCQRYSDGIEDLIQP